jgi:UDP-2-acetamido-2,6-beta-L-arabino-hexul-4-ose reductase
MNIVITGVHGFIGKNLVDWLKRESKYSVQGYGRQDSWSALADGLATADIVFHLAGVNRPQTEADFYTGNVAFTEQICDYLLAIGRPVPLVLTSSIQAMLDNPYGISKRQAEQVFYQYAAKSGERVAIYRLKNVFGKWCRPNYNSVVATFCYHISNNLPVTISDPGRVLDLIHVDDLIRCFLTELEDAKLSDVCYREVTPSYQINLARLAEIIQSFPKLRQTLCLPDLSDEFTYKLYSTYLSYLNPDNFAYNLEKKCDNRGCLAEFVKSASAGQIFISRTHPGITRGNHYHHIKTEKFLVLEGDAIIRFRNILDENVIEYSVRGEDFRVVDIPPGYTHAIENIGSNELITLFWASEVFNPTRADTNALSVLS